jgi:hypothetical protein
LGEVIDENDEEEGRRKGSYSFGTSNLVDERDKLPTNADRI